MAKRFFIGLIIGLMMGGSAVIALNLFVDPTGYARVVNLRNTAYCRASESFVSDRFSRVLRFQPVNPRTVVLGTSRVKNGIYKSALSESGYTGNLFNFGFRGMTATEMAELLPRIARSINVRSLIAGIDYGMFAGQQKGSGRKPIVWTDKNKLLSWFTPFFRAFVTIPVTGASLKSLWSGCQARWFTADGFPSPEAEYRVVASDFPERVLFDIPERNEQRQSRSYQAMSDLIDRGGSLSLFSIALGDVCALGRKIDIFIEPAHARLNEIRFKDAWWPEIENWKRKLTGVVGKLQAKGCEITLTDFSGYNHVTTFPFDQGNNPTKYYLEPSHYTRIVGNSIIRRLSGAEKNIPVDSFGVTLTPKNVEAQIERIRDERIAYVKDR